MRIFWRFLIAVAFIGAVAVIALSLGWPFKLPTDALNPIVAAFAVIAAVISAWGAQNLVDREEDAKQPWPSLSFDVTSRYTLAQLVLSNLGGTPAFDVRIHWDTQPINHKGVPVRFSDRADGIEAPILSQGEHVSVLIDSTVSLFKQETLVYTGTISYARFPGGKSQGRKFYVSGEQYRHTLTFADEMPMTLHELQKVPDALAKISGELSAVKWLLMSQTKDTVKGVPEPEEKKLDSDQSPERKTVSKEEPEAVSLLGRPHDDS
jgi:hypothetical protein